MVLIMEIRSGKKETEVRSIGELRGVEEDGTFEGYLTVWDTVDDYNSTFTRGSFNKTIQERGSQVKVMYDHEHLVGSSIELREDDHGVYGKGKLNLAVDKAAEAYEFMKDGTLDKLSFGFRTIKEGFSNGVRQIKEVQLYEFGPVVFPANEAADITSVRSQDFTESLTEEQLQEETYALRNALYTTLSDIWWSQDTDIDNVIGKLDGALADFHASYLDYARRWVDTFWKQSETRSTPFDNHLATTFNNFLMKSRKTMVELASESPFTVAELTELRQGNIIANREPLKELSDELVLAHREQRNTAVETLCTELRGSLTDSETRRINALLKPVEERQSEPVVDSEIADLMAYFKHENETGE